MKTTKLSLVAALAVSAAVAGGDIVPVEPVVAAPVASSTTISGKLQGYYYTDDATDDMFGDQSQLGLAVTLDVSHKFNEMFTANFSAVGAYNAIGAGDTTWGYMEGSRSDGFMNVANLTATFGDTTMVLGRQILDTPMVKSFDWLLAPEAYEAYTVVNGSIENLTLVGSYIRTYRSINSGDNFVDLTDIGDGNNWTVGAAYATDAFNASAWYYNVDAGDYTQVYVDAGTKLSSIDLAAQYIGTDHGAVADSDAFGIKAATEISGVSLMAAYNNVADNTVGYVGADGLYTSSWNTFASNSVGDAFKVEASTEISGLSVTGSYAYYEYEQVNDEGHEIDLILGYDVTDSISLGAIYSNTDYGVGSDTNAFELIATYKF